jgi:hypothetical protein
MRIPNAKAIHIAKSLKSQPHESKLTKEYVFANATNRMKNIKRKHNTKYSA